jgi:hypothetical protein
MLMRKRRNSVSCASLYFMMSSPSMIISPAVGSIRREMQRTSVDFPLPDKDDEGLAFLDFERNVVDANHVSGLGLYFGTR